jgi:hypothetical protein
MRRIIRCISIVFLLTHGQFIHSRFQADKQFPEKIVIKNNTSRSAVLYASKQENGVELQAGNEYTLAIRADTTTNAIVFSHNGTLYKLVYPNAKDKAASYGVSIKHTLDLNTIIYLANLVGTQSQPLDEICVLNDTHFAIKLTDQRTGSQVKIASGDLFRKNARCYNEKIPQNSKGQLSISDGQKNYVLTYPMKVCTNKDTSDSDHWNSITLHASTLFLLQGYKVAIAPYEAHHLTTQVT